MTNKPILMTLIIAMTFLIGFSAQEAFSGVSPAIYEEPLDGTILNLLFPSAQPVADDFVIVTATTITDFHVLLIEIPGGFDGNVQYAIYEDDNGLPGALVQDGSGTAQGGMTANPFSCLGLVCFDFWANLETPVPLEPGTYWIEFSGQSASWAVALDDVFFGSEAAFFSGNWFPLTIVFGFPVGVSFSITGEIEDDTTPPQIECPANITIGAEEDSSPANTGTPGVSDDMDPSPTVTFSDVVTVNPDGSTTITRTWTATDEAGNTAGCTQEITILPLPVDIDIKPGSDPNSINTRSKGVVPVAILGSATLDVTTVDVTTLMFGNASPAHDLSDSDTYNEHIQDVNGDGFLDLVSHYKQKDIGIACGDTEATLTGALLDGTSLAGSDSVRTVPCK